MVYIVGVGAGWLAVGPLGSGTQSKVLETVTSFGEKGIWACLMTTAVLRAGCPAGAFGQSRGGDGAGVAASRLTSYVTVHLLFAWFVVAELVTWGTQVYCYRRGL